MNSKAADGSSVYVAPAGGGGGGRGLVSYCKVVTARQIYDCECVSFELDVCGLTLTGRGQYVTRFVGCIWRRSLAEWLALVGENWDNINDESECWTFRP